MPDLERLTDQLRIDMAPTPRSKAYARGYSQGKSRARTEVVFVIGVIALLILLGFATTAGAATPDWSSQKWESFLTALRQTETGGEPNGGLGAVGDSGDAIGPYQIHKSCYKDACEFDKSLDKGYDTCKNDLEYSKRVVRAYVSRYWKAGNTPEDMARLWNSGPGWAKKKSKTEGYVKRFRKFFSV